MLATSPTSGSGVEEGQQRCLGSLAELGLLLLRVG